MFTESVNVKRQNWFGHCWSVEAFGHGFGRSINIFKATAWRRNVRGCPSPDPGQKQWERKNGWMKKLYQCKTNKMKQRDLPERCAAVGQRKRTTGCSGEQEGGRDRESEQRTRDPPSRGERPSEWGGQGCVAWLCSPLGGARSPCGEPAAEPEQEGSGDTERPRHDESESECERTSKRAWEQKWTVLVCLS